MRREAKILGILGFAAKTIGFLRGSLGNRRNTVRITPIMLKHASWHVIRQSGQAVVRDLDGFQ
jgi:hypothetical protein